MQNKDFHIREAELCKSMGDLESAEVHFYAAYEAASEAYASYPNDTTLFAVAEAAFELGKFEFEQDNVDEGDRFFIEALRSLNAGSAGFRTRLSHYTGRVTQAYIECSLYAQAKATNANHRRWYVQ